MQDWLLSYSIEINFLKNVMVLFEHYPLELQFLETKLIYIQIPFDPALLLTHLYG